MAISGFQSKPEQRAGLAIWTGECCEASERKGDNCQSSCMKAQITTSRSETHSHVAGNQRLFPLGLDPDGNMARRVAQRGLKVHSRTHNVVQRNHIDKPGINNGFNRVSVDIVAVGIGGLAPVFEFFFGKEVAGVFEGRDPLAVDELGVETDVVDVPFRRR